MPNDPLIFRMFRMEDGIMECAFRCLSVQSVEMARRVRKKWTEIIAADPFFAREAEKIRKCDEWYFQDYYSLPPSRRSVGSYGSFLRFFLGTLQFVHFARFKRRDFKINSIVIL